MLAHVINYCRENPIVKVLIHFSFATKRGVRDLFAQGLEADPHEEIVVSKFERKKLAKVRTTIQKEKYFENLALYVPSNSAQSPIT